MQLRHRGADCEKLPPNHLVLPGKFCRETYSFKFLNRSQLRREHRDRAGHPQETLEIRAQGSQIGEGDTPPFPAYAPQHLSGGVLRKEVKVGLREGLPDLRQVRHMPAPWFVLAILGRRSERSAGNANRPGKENKQNADESE